MPTDADLNEFQRDAEAQLTTALRDLGRELEGRIIYTGFDDATIHAHVAGTPLEVWIYPDGASYGRGRVKQQRRFEALDYGNDLAALARGFTLAIVRECEAIPNKR